MTESKLKDIPGFTQGVRTNAAMRTVKLLAPICPNSQTEYEMMANGQRVARPKGANAQNCQLAGGQWWIDCEARGHDPYFTHKVWYTVSDMVDETGMVTGQRKERHEEIIPNVVQVPVSRRMHSGQGVKNSMQRKGRIRLKDKGYREVCQFRNCQRPISPKARSKAYGDYCSPEHLRLVAADAQGEFLQMVDNGALKFAAGSEERILKRREEQLRKVGAFATE